MIVKLLNPGLANPGCRLWRVWVETGKAVQLGKMLVMAQADRVDGVYYPSVTIYDLDFNPLQHTLMASVANLAALGEPFAIVPRAMDQRNGPPSRVLWEICGVAKQIVKTDAGARWYWPDAERWFASATGPYNT